MHQAIEKTHTRDIVTDSMAMRSLFEMLAGIASMAIATSLSAETISLEIPLDCDMTRTCQIQNHFDHDSGPDFRDYTCGSLGYDGHNGVDFRLPNLEMMRQGVPVIAAASGIVRAIRDEMDDISIRKTGLNAINKREAGNSVAIDHGNGWETQYSHLRKGSIRVKPGEHVRAGQVLGLVGLSGKTEFPHLHFTVRYKGKPLDPFNGLGLDEKCGIDNPTLWSASALSLLPYRSTGILQSGFAPEAPKSESVEEGLYSARTLQASVPALAFWVEVYGPKEGDQWKLELFSPEGKTLAENRETFSRNRARWFGYVGMKRPPGNWPTGTYRGRFELWRQSSVKPGPLIIREQSIIID
jgi:hypothetical protein